jgi:hypothetical protein
VTVVLKRGKGSHCAVLLGTTGRTTLKDRTKEIGRGLFAAMPIDLGVDKSKF